MDAELRDAFKEVNDKLDHMAARYDRVLYGNGQPGLVREVDRLTQSHETQKWTVRAVAAVVIGVVVKLVAGAIH